MGNLLFVDLSKENRDYERSCDLEGLFRYIWAGAILFSEWEDWNMLDGSYFCFVSLSTIGFGDIVPGDKIYAAQGLDLSFIFCSMYLMLGECRPTSQFYRFRRLMLPIPYGHSLFPSSSTFVFFLFSFLSLDK